MVSRKTGLALVAAAVLTSGAAFAQTPDPATTDPSANGQTGGTTPIQAAAAQATTPPPMQVSGKNDFERFAERIDITAIPAGALWVTDGHSNLQPGFQAYTPGAAFGVKLSNYVAVEAETAFATSSKQELHFDGAPEGFVHTPTLFGYTGNVIVNARPADRQVVPYAVGGIGGMFVSRRAELGIDSGSNFFIGDVGGGAKVMFGKWGVRGDYRFLMLNGQQDDDSFVGSRTRFGHRIYAGLVVAPGRNTSSGK